MRETSFLPFGITKMMQTRAESSLLFCRVQLIFAFLLQRYKGLKRPVSFSSIFSSVSCDTRPILRQFPGDQNCRKRRYFDHDHDYDYDLFVHRDTETQSILTEHKITSLRSVIVLTPKSRYEGNLFPSSSRPPALSRVTYSCLSIPCFFITAA